MILEGLDALERSLDSLMTCLHVNDCGEFTKDKITEGISWLSKRIISRLYDHYKG